MMINQTFCLVSIILAFAGCTPSPRYSVRKPAAEHLIVKNSQSGTASYYAHKFHGRKTANGEIFDMNTLTAAHLTLPFNTRVRVTNLRNNKTVTVRINDRGPYAKGRIIDLSLEAAKTLDMLKTGTAEVRLDILEKGK